MSFEELLRATYESNAETRDAIPRVEAQLAEIRRVLPPRLVPLKEAAKLFGVSDATARRRCEKGEWPARREGGKWVVDLGTMHVRVEEEHAVLLRRARSEVKHDEEGA
jgi:hypothetical protein